MKLHELTDVSNFSFVLKERRGLDVIPLLTTGEYWQSQNPSLGDREIVSIHSDGENNMIIEIATEKFPRYIYTTDGYIGCFCRTTPWGSAEYRFVGGIRIADHQELARGCNTYEEAERAIREYAR